MKIEIDLWELVDNARSDDDCGDTLRYWARDELRKRKDEVDDRELAWAMWEATLVPISSRAASRSRTRSTSSSGGTNVEKLVELLEQTPTWNQARPIAEEIGRLIKTELAEVRGDVSRAREAAQTARVMASSPRSR